MLVSASPPVTHEMEGPSEHTLAVAAAANGNVPAFATVEADGALKRWVTRLGLGRSK
jgi:hypothetical protein